MTENLTPLHQIPSFYCCHGNRPTFSEGTAAAPLERRASFLPRAGVGAPQLAAVAPSPAPSAAASSVGADGRQRKGPATELEQVFVHLCRRQTTETCGNCVIFSTAEPTARGGQGALAILRRPRTLSTQGAARENGLVDQDAEGSFYHCLLPRTQPAVAKRRSLRRGRGGVGVGVGALGRYPGDDGFFHAGDDHGVPESSQPSENVRNDKLFFFFFFLPQNKCKSVCARTSRSEFLTFSVLTCATVTESSFTNTHLTIACVLLETTGQDRKSCGPSKASWVPRRDRQALSCCQTWLTQRTERSMTPSGDQIPDPTWGGGIIHANERFLERLIMESIRQQTSSDLMEQPPAELPSQQAVQRLLVPTKGHPAKVLLEAEL